MASEPSDPRDAEWARLAAEVQAQVEADAKRRREMGEEEVDDDDTELYADVAMDLVDESSAPPQPDLLPQLARAMEGQERHLPELELDPLATEEDELELDPPSEAAFVLPEPEAAELPELDWRALHPRSIWINLIPRTWRVIIGYWPFVLGILFLNGGGGGEAGFQFQLMDLLFLFLFLGGGAANTVVHFLTLRYRVHQGKLEIKQGLLNRQARTIDPARIQNVGEVRNFFHNLAGLVEVRIETAGDVRTEGLLSALSEADAQELMTVLGRLRGLTQRTPAEDEPEPEPVLKLSVLELFAFGLSRASAGLVVVLLAVGLEVLPMLGADQAADTVESFSPLAVGSLLALALVASWLGSALLAVIKHFGFRLDREDDDDPRKVALSSREGLFTTRRMRVPLGKVQLVMADEPVLRRAMGFGTVSVETAGLGSVKDGVAAAELSVPMADQDEMPRLMREALPGLDVDPWTLPLKPAHPRALYRMIFGSLMRTTLLALPLALLLDSPWGLLALGLYPVNLLATWLDWRAQGWLVTPDVVISRRGFWRRRTWILARDKVQSVHLVQSPLMRLHGLGRLAVRVAGSQVLLPDIGFDPAAGLLEELTPRPR